jgi:hypothetical protein
MPFRYELTWISHAKRWRKRYLRRMSADRRQQFNGRGHFFAAAAEAMRRILVEAMAAEID